MNRFPDVVSKYVKASGLSYRKIGELTGLPATTINGWANGHTKKPRVLKDVILFAKGLNLNEIGLAELLAAAEFPSLVELFAADDSEIQNLLTPWAKLYQERLKAPFQVPRLELAHFVGREAELVAIIKTLHTGDKICVTHGMPGVGKSSLAVHTAHQQRLYFPDGILWATIPPPA